MYANHFGLMVQGGDGAFKLVERYDEEREIGTDSTLIRLSVELSNMANGSCANWKGNEAAFEGNRQSDPDLPRAAVSEGISDRLTAFNHFGARRYSAPGSW